MRKTIMVLVGDIVHDLYTPLAIIGDGAEILESISSGLNEVVKEANDFKSKKLNSINRKKLNYVINEMSAAQKYSIQMINDFIKTTLRELSVAQKYRDKPISREELTKCSSCVFRIIRTAKTVLFERGKRNIRTGSQLT